VARARAWRGKGGSKAVSSDWFSIARQKPSNLIVLFPATLTAVRAALLPLFTACAPEVTDEAPAPADDWSLPTPGGAGDSAPPGGAPTGLDSAALDSDPVDARLEALTARLEAGISGTPGLSAPAGVSFALVLDGALAAAGGVGAQAKVGQPRSDQPVGPETLFFVASTSKWITAAAAMSLVDDGLLTPDTRAVDLLPSYTEAAGRHADITLHHLLTMTSGLANDGGCWLYSESESLVPDGCAAFTAGPGTVLEMLFQPEVLASSPYDGSLGAYNVTSAPPGAAPWSYSNWGMMLAGRLLEVAAGAAFEDLVAARVFGPAGMTTAGFSASEMVASDDYAIGGGPSAADGHCPEPVRGHDSLEPFFPDELACPARAPNGGVRASALDLAAFAEALLADLDGAGRALSQAQARRLFCPGGGAPGAGCAGRGEVDPAYASAYGDTYGYANFRHTHGGREVYTHGGGRAGFGALFWVVPSQGFAVAMLSNDDGASVDLQAAAAFAMDCYLDGAC